MNQRKVTVLMNDGSKIFGTTHGAIEMLKCPGVVGIAGGSDLILISLANIHHVVIHDVLKDDN